MMMLGSVLVIAGSIYLDGGGISDAFRWEQWLLQIRRQEINIYILLLHKISPSRISLKQVLSQFGSSGGLLCSNLEMLGG